jgi:hypothetical protein
MYWSVTVSGDAVGSTCVHNAVATTPRELCSVIKASLMAPDGEEYFENSFKNAMVPGGAGGVTMFIGTLLSANRRRIPALCWLRFQTQTIFGSHMTSSRRSSAYSRKRDCPARDRFDCC